MFEGGSGGPSSPRPPKVAATAIVLEYCKRFSQAPTDRSCDELRRREGGRFLIRRGCCHRTNTLRVQHTVPFSTFLNPSLMRR